MKVKDLVEKLQQFDPELEIVGYQSGMEQTGVQKVNLYPMVQKMELKQNETWDRFDGTVYRYEVYVQSPHGTEVLRLF